MSFDQYLEAKEAGLDFLTEDFVEAWRPVVRGDFTDGEPVEVIGYLGTVLGDPDMKSLLDAGQRDAWERRFEASIAPLVEAGMGIGFDAITGGSLDHPAFHKLTELQSRGVPVYIEAWPKKSRPHWRRFGVVVLERMVLGYVSSHRDEFVDPDRLSRGLVRLLNGHTRRFYDELPDDRWQTAAAMEILGDGHILAMDFSGFIRDGWTPEALIEAARDEAAASIER